MEGGVGVRQEEFSFCGKNLLSLHMAHRENDKYSDSSRTMNNNESLTEFRLNN